MKIINKLLAKLKLSNVSKNVSWILIQNIYTQMVEYIFYMGAITAILGGVLLIIKVMRLKEN